MRYEILPSLPSYGPLYISVAEADEPFYSEGFVVKFTKTDGASWVGNFKPGGRSLNTVLELQHTDYLLVIAGGTVYIMHPDQTKPVDVFGYGYTAVFTLDDGRLLLQDTYSLTIVEAN